MTMAALNPPLDTARRGSAPRALRRGLDLAYLCAGYLAAAAIAAILFLTLAQILGRLTGHNFRGLTDYAGYLMAASAFLAFAHTLNSGGHIRIELFLSLSGRFRSIAEKTAFGLSALIAGWLAYYSCRLVYWSYKLGDLSTGLDATPLWIPQLAMAAGSVLLALAIADQFVKLVVSGAHSVPASTESL
jgi:TRAP-type C4-dicarboxylate transport system permease small subunit